MVTLNYIYGICCCKVRYGMEFRIYTLFLSKTPMKPLYQVKPGKVNSLECKKYRKYTEMQMQLLILLSKRTDVQNMTILCQNSK